MPATDDFAALHDAFAQRKPEVGAEIFDGINAVVPAEERDIESCDFNRVAETFVRAVLRGWRPVPTYRPRRNVILSASEKRFENRY